MAIPTREQCRAWADEAADEAITDTALMLGKPASEVHEHLSADGLKLLILKAISMNRVVEMRFIVAKQNEERARLWRTPDSPGC